MEKDAYSTTPIAGFDYVIGSAHYLRKEGDFCAVDISLQDFTDGVNRMFGGDFYAAAENYYSGLSTVVQQTNADIIGHFDLITKFNEKYNLFDTDNPRYVRAWQAAADALLKTGKPFEVNTGAIARGWRTAPYPATEIIAYIKACGGKFVFSSDGHNKDNIAYHYTEIKDILR